MKLKTKFIVVAFAAVLFLVLNTERISSKIAQPPAGNNGNPTSTPAGQTCAQCHSGSALLNSETKAEIKIGETATDSALDNFNYELNKTYQISFKANTLGKRFGFQLSALSSTNQNAGTFVLTNTTNTSKLSIPITYVGHKNASATNTWLFNWQSPITDIGDITFYYTFVAADSNDDSTNDTVYLGTATARPLITGIKDAAAISNLAIYPNPVKGDMNVSFTATSNQAVELNLYSIDGKLIKQLSAEKIATNFNSTFNLADFTCGIYLLQIKSGNKLSHRKIVVE